MGLWTDIIHTHLNPPELPGHPDLYSYLSVLLSIIYAVLSVRAYPASYLITILFVILLLDIFDGWAARKMKEMNPHVDLACDRVSELAIFSVHPILLPLAMLNVITSVRKIKLPGKIPLILPLRHLLLLFLVFPNILPSII